MKKSKKLKTLDMELALATFFDKRTNLIVPNVSWGLFFHELDLLVLTKSGYGYEVEIKISRADLIKDKEKRHGHRDHRIKYLYFAIPDYLEKDIEHIPERAGIILVCNERHTCRIIRKPEQNSKYKFKDTERYQLARLGALRIWRLKHKLNKLNKETK